MNALNVTALYAGALGMIFIILTWRVIAFRRANQIGLGDNGDKSLLKRIRAQGNFIETAPFAIVLLGVAESQGTPSLALHLLGLMLLCGRALHGYGLSASPPKMALRALGMVLTLTMIALTSLGVFAHALVRLI